MHIRHRLTSFLREVDSHVAYDVVPTERRGHATAMLAALLPVAAALEIECPLLTCDAANVGSRRAPARWCSGQRGAALRLDAVRPRLRLSLACRVRCRFT